MFFLSHLLAPGCDVGGQISASLSTIYIKMCFSATVIVKPCIAVFLDILYEHTL